MDINYNLRVPVPVVNQKETEALDTLTDRYNKLIEPGIAAKLGAKAGKLIPQKLKTWGHDLGLNISEQEIYTQNFLLVKSRYYAK